MLIVYTINNKTYKTKRSNSDLRIHFHQDDEHVRVSLTALKDIKLVDATEVIPFNVNYHDSYFLNGYQSWTDTKEFKLAKRLRNVKKSPHLIVWQFAMTKYGDSTFYNYSIKKSHGYDIFYSKGKYESFIYNMNYKNAYLLIELRKDRRDIFLESMVKGISLAKGEEVTIFDYYYFDDFQRGLESFKNSFPRISGTEKLFGYTSWYNYYQNINEEIILRDLDALDDRFNVFQIDDGYETFVGDWLDVDSKKFPNGLKPILEKIHSRGFKAGIWLAPFAAETNSKLFKEHPDWIKKDSHKKPLIAGGNWSKFYALDLDKEEVRDYIRKCLRHYADMGFDFFKLDFLYAAGLELSKGKSRAQTQYEAYSFLRDVLKDKLILGCGANIISSYQNFDYLRVGPDVSLEFDDVRIMRLFHRERISTKVTLQNTIYRSLFDKHLFYNDPDVFLLRSGNIKLSSEQRKALTTINAIFGSLLMTSDNISTYDEKQKEVLDHALDIFEHASSRSFKTRGKDKIDIKYTLKGKEYELTYNINKGVFTHE